MIYKTLTKVELGECQSLQGQMCEGHKGALLKQRINPKVIYM